MLDLNTDNKIVKGMEYNVKRFSNDFTNAEGKLSHLYQIVLQNDKH